MKHLKLLFFFAILGCENGETPETLAQQYKVASLKSAEGIANEIFHEHMVEEKTFVASVSPGDTVEITVQGITVTPQFSEYTERVESFWTVMHSIFGLKMVGVNLASLRHVDDHYGHCDLLYRQYDGEKNTPLSYEELDRYPLHFSLGGDTYPIRNITFTKNFQESGPSVISGSLTITKQMLLNGDDLFLDVFPGPDPEKITLGFFSYGHCQGKGKRSFKVYGNTESEEMEYQVSNKFVVSLSIKHKRTFPFNYPPKNR